MPAAWSSPRRSCVGIPGAGHPSPKRRPRHDPRRSPIRAKRSMLSPAALVRDREIAVGLPSGRVPQIEGNTDRRGHGDLLGSATGREQLVKQIAEPGFEHPDFGRDKRRGRIDRQCVDARCAQHRSFGALSNFAGCGARRTSRQVPVILPLPTGRTSRLLSCPANWACGRAKLTSLLRIFPTLRTSPNSDLISLTTFTD